MIKLSLITPALHSREDQDHLWWISEAIKAGLAPWDPGKITFYSSNYDGAFLPCLTVETELLPRLPFSMQLDMLRMDEHQAMCAFADAAFEWFRNRHQMPVEDHIVLGTD